MINDEGPSEGDEAGGDGEDEDRQLEVGDHSLVHYLSLVDSANKAIIILH